MYRHIDAAGRVTYSNQPAQNGESVTLETEIQVQSSEDPADAAANDALQKARQKRREIQRWADREDRRHRAAARQPSGNQAGSSFRAPFQPMMPVPNGPARMLPQHRSGASAEAHCQSQYGKPCAELENWKSAATADCQRRNLSQDCKSDDYLRSQRPRTRDEQQRIDEKRQKRRDRRDRRVEKEIDALRRRGGAR
jgi:hypothetical protein